MTGWTASEPHAEVFAAMVAAVGSLEDIKRSETAEVETRGGGKYSYTYADLADAVQAIRPVAAEHSLAVIQIPHGGPEQVSVTTLVLHTSGEWISFDPLVLRGGAPQESGSAISYARRYTLLPVLGLATEDDDGVAAASAHRPPERPQSAPAGRAPSRAGASFRTREEAEMRALIDAMTPADRQAVQEDFKREFGTTLSKLAKDRHAEALRFVQWLADPEGDHATAVAEADVRAEDGIGYQ